MEDQVEDTLSFASITEDGIITLETVLTGDVRDFVRAVRLFARAVGFADDTVEEAFPLFREGEDS